MRDYKTVCLVLVICGGLTLIYAEQKKPSWPIPQTQPQQPQPQQPQARVSPEQNKVPVHQLFEDLFTQGRYELTGKVFARNCVVHFGNRTVALNEAVAEGNGWRSAAPDLVMSVDQISVSGDMVNVIWSARATHTGVGNGLKPTGKRISMRSASRFRVMNGQIVEAWNQEYRPELFRQLGVSKTQAFLFFAGERFLAAVDPIIPDRLYASLQ
jgi:predicted ester cyclase